MGLRRRGSAFSSWRRIPLKQRSHGKDSTGCERVMGKGARLRPRSHRAGWIAMAKLILWAILIVLFARSVSRLLHGVLEGAGYTRGNAPQSVGLVRDPVCGVFVVPGRALSAGTGNATRYFCSESCRREWLKR